MQYIYAENYDVVDYQGAYTKMTPNGGSSTRKYYWIVLPDQAYSNGFGETYVATFENLAEPVYFIVFDTHACPHQSEDYCGKASSNPDGVEIGKEFFGTFTKNAGSPTAAAEIAGKLTSLCRIEGSGEVTVSSDSNKLSSAVSGSSLSLSSPSSSSDSSNGSAQAIADKARELAWSESNRSKTYSKSGGYPTEAFRQAATEVGTNADSDDCLNFVQTVILSSGADEDFPKRDTSNWSLINDYLNPSDKWNEITAKEESDLQPGDVLVSAVNGFGNNHILIYLGNSKVAQANYTEWYGRIDNISDAWCTSWGGTTPFKCVDNDFRVFRLGSGNCTTYEGDYPEYIQGDYSDVSYGSGGRTIASSGCGAASIAMLVTYVTGQDVFPQDIAKLLGNSYYWATGGEGASNLTKKVCEKYGCKAETVAWSSRDDAVSKMEKYLSEGYSIHLSGAGTYPFSSGGHYIGIFKSTGGGRVMTANSAYGGNAELSLRDVVNAGMHYNFTILKGNGSKNSCDNYCPTEQASIAEGGLSPEQAAKLAEYYNNGGGTLCGGGQRNNCYAFSMWWLCNFTDIVAEGVNACGGIVNTGDEVVPKCLGSPSHFNLPTGDYNEPRPYAVFSTTAGGVMNGSIHTGVVTAVHDDGTIDFIDAWYPSSNNPSGKLASVYTNITPIGPTSYAYVEDHVDMSKLKEIVGD